MESTKKIMSSLAVTLLLSCQTLTADEVPSAVVESDKQIIDYDFEAAKAGLLPIPDPKKIQQLNRDMKTVIGAVNGKPVDISRISENILLEPGATIPTLHMSPGYVVAISFVDSQGEPWPVSSQTVGNPTWFALSKPEGLKPGNLLTISSLSPKAHTNAIVTLQGLNSPIFISLRTTDITKSKLASGSVTYQMAGASPLAPPPVFSKGAPNAISKNMMSFLNGTPPDGSVSLDIDRDDLNISIWSLEGHYYLRTSRDLIWPAWSEDARSGDIKVYELPKTSRLKLSDAALGNINVRIQ
jgi:hypothetical protein